MRLKKRFVHIFLLGIISIFFFTACASTGSNRDALKPLHPFSFESRYIVAVMPFEFKGEQDAYKDMKNKLVDLVVDELFRTKRFRIVERSRIDMVLEEIKLSQLGIIDGKIANKIGQQVGAEMVIVGTISSINPIMKRDSAGFAWRETRGFEISLQGRLIDIGRGEVSAVADATGIETQEQKMGFGAKTGVIAPEKTLINKALETAVQKMVYDLASDISPK